MTLTLRTKILGIAAVATLALVTIAVVGIVSTRGVAEQLAKIQTRQIPLIELRPRLESDLERIERGFQDAVAAQDPDGLASVAERRTAFLGHLSAARGAVDPRTAGELRSALDDYYHTARSLSRRLIDGETGEDLVEAMRAMQAKQARTQRLIERVSRLRQDELQVAFAHTVELENRTLTIQLWTGLACVLLVGLLSLLLSRQILRTLAELSAGLERFGRGELATPIRLHGTDELARVAERANAMAASLDALSRARDRTVWLGRGLTGLALELRGDLAVEEAARRATGFLARYLDAPAGALYYRDASNGLELLAHHALSGDDGEPRVADEEPRGAFRPGEGLVGQAAEATEPLLIEDLPADYIRIRSGLGEASPRALLLVPLVADDRPMGVLELAFLERPGDEAIELLSSAQRTIAITIEVARARAASRKLLGETQAQAGRLSMQEEELRTTNEELETQQEELRQTNEELTRQAEALDEHRRVLEAKNVELEEAQRALELRASELATVSSYKSQFLTNMSHELRTPLNSMLLLSSLLGENQSGNLTDKEVGYCKTIHTAGQELLALINQVLDLAKVEAGKTELELRDVDVRELIDYVRISFEPIAREKGLYLEAEVGSDVPEAITTDRQRALQILNNLIANAIKFTEQGGVRVTVRRPVGGTDLGRPGLAPAETVTIEVTDTGPGVAPEDRDRVFSAFEQADASIGRRHGGTGLGLAISRELAELLGGSLLLESTRGAGSTFRCHLPTRGPSARNPSTDSKGAGGTRRSRATALPNPARSGILVVEDDAAFAAGLVEMIRELGHEVWVASDGESALRLAREHRPRGHHPRREAPRHRRLDGDGAAPRDAGDGIDPGPLRVRPRRRERAPRASARSAT